MPTLHKLIALAQFQSIAAQLLYVDCDTFFFGDVEALFSKYGEKDFYAREEPCSRRSRLFAYDPGHIDEDALSEMAASLGVAWVPPYNSGVFLLNRDTPAKLAALQGEFLSLAWRLTAGATLRPGLEFPDAIRLGAAEWLKNAGNRPIPYPSGSFWTLDQIALGFTLGRVAGLSHSPFAAGDVLQGAEFDIYPSFRRVTLAHYFSGNESLFTHRLAMGEG